MSPLVLVRLTATTSPSRWAEASPRSGDLQVDQCGPVGQGIGDRRPQLLDPCFWRGKGSGKPEPADRRSSAMSISLNTRSGIRGLDLTSTRTAAICPGVGVEASTTQQQVGSSLDEGRWNASTRSWGGGGQTDGVR